MKRFPKLIVTLLLLAMVIGIFAAMPVSAAADYEALRLKSAHLTVGHYTTTAMDGDIVKHSANKDYNHEIGCLIDNDNNGGYWSKPYKFNDLRESDGKPTASGKITPVILIDVAAFNNGSPLAVAAFDLRLRSFMDCRPLHVVLQVTTAADSNNWNTVADKKFTYADWDASPKQRIEFTETTVYKFRMLVYEIGEADIAQDEYPGYDILKGDETRFTLSEIDLLRKKEGDSTSNGGSTSTNPTNPGNQGATRPGIQFPTQPSATKAPTQPATKAPTQPATQTPTTNTEPTGTVAPTEHTATVDPSAPTEPTETVDPSAPAVDPSAPTEEPTVAPTDEPTVAPTEGEPTVGVTEPETTTPATDNGGEQKPDNTWIIIVAIVAAAAVAGVAIFFIIKKKKNG